MKRKLSLILVVVLMLSLVGCGSEEAKTQGENSYKIAVLYSGYLGDQSFNDSAHQGLQKILADYDNVEIREFETDVASEWEPNAIAAAEAGYDLILGVSYVYSDVLKNVAPQYPESKFAVIDGEVTDNNGNPIDNVVSAIFAQNEGSFLAGAAAAMFTTKTEIDGVNPDKKIGWLGGSDIPVLHDFLGGYKQGAAYIDPEVEVVSVFVGTFSDPVAGKEQANALYDQNIDIIMNVASGTGNGLLEAAEERNLYAIGVDIDQDGLKPGHILTSMLKRVDVTTYEIISSVINETFEGGKTLYMDINSGGVGLTDMSTMKNALGDKFPEDILTKIQEIQELVKKGEIEVVNYEGFGKK
ncbi:BMP family lipoprotein [Clostridium formicaceticum]|uniref:BMP family ABC transporter substrate-binding protein n=1 Tax=Clostridium formicaceticum TaxID=1497 RepID=A0AAC9RHB5_9CLOT|nr:BMP family ABC transporter substrate-binding protein [Clostridium formicaceticum]AOY76556.1 BMP family ABC transporter substrate-binding protein [Clostridium formicaceticum]ARE86974.1 Membrane lipoprotein TmpC precursor [Clostridium formicaceticum]